MFREEALPALCNAGPLSWANWNLILLVFQEGRKLENVEKNLQRKAKNNNKLYPGADLDPKSNPGHIGERQALSPLGQPCSFKMP